MPPLRGSYDRNALTKRLNPTNLTGQLRLISLILKDVDEDKSSTALDWGLRYASETFIVADSPPQYLSCDGTCEAFTKSKKKNHSCDFCGLFLEGKTQYWTLTSKELDMCTFCYARISSFPVLTISEQLAAQNSTKKRSSTRTKQSELMGRQNSLKELGLPVATPVEDDQVLVVIPEMKANPTFN